MPGRRRNQSIPTDLGIIVGVVIDKAGGDSQIRRVNNLLCAGGDFTNFSDLAIRDRDIGLDRLCAGTINHSAILNQQLVGHMFPLPVYPPVFSTCSIVLYCSFVNGQALGVLKGITR